MPLTEEERNQHFDTITNSETIADRALAIEALRNDSIELNSNLTESESLLNTTTKNYAESQTVIRSLLQSIPNAQGKDEIEKPTSEPEQKIRGFASLRQ